MQRTALKMLKNVTVRGKKRRKTEEFAHQKAFVRWFRLSHPSYVDLLTISSFGENIGAARMAQLKAMGLVPGYPDLMLCVPTPKHPGLFIEMKKPKGRLSPHQKEIHKILKAQRYKVVTCYHWEEARWVTQDYLAGCNANK